MYNINVFLFYSIFGNIFERIIMYFRDKTYVSGFMGTIFTPIYGIAILIVIYIHNKLKIKNKYLKMIIEFLIYIVVLGSVEFIGGLLIEKVFNKVYWNYDNFKFNIGIYTSLEVALVWSLLSIIVLYFIHPLFIKLEKRIPKWLTISLSIFFIINLIFSLLVKMT